MTDQSCGDIRPDKLAREVATPSVASVPPLVVVRKVVNGFIVEIGCQTFVATNWGNVSEGLELYWRDPLEAQKKYCGEQWRTGC